jgi:YebC/PmpR family DNA-binding regulatory protein
LSGHSKWATTKHKKAAIDAQRGKLFAKLIKNIEVAAKIGGMDLAGNPTLFDAVQKAKKNSVPNDNINRAIKRGGGADGGGVNYESVVYEGYAPGGVAVLVECLTDNKNRAASDVRLVFGKNGGQLADPGSVSYLFSRKGVIMVPKQNLTEDQILETTITAEVEDINDLGGTFEIVTSPKALIPTRELLQQANFDYDSADVVFQPASYVQLDFEKTRKALNLIESLEDLDDVQEVYSNLEISDDFLAQLN